MLEIIITSSVLILCILAIRKFFMNRINPVLQYSLWLLVLIRLMLPFSFPSPVSIMNAVPEYSRNIGMTDAPIMQAPIMPMVSAGSQFSHPETQEYIQPSHNNTQDVKPNSINPFQIIFAVWLCVFIAILIRILSNNIMFARKIRREAVSLNNFDCRLPVYMLENLPSPCLFGVFKPKIIVSARVMDQNHIKYVLAHELCHYRYKDNWLSLLRSLCCALYWFNPLVWIAAHASKIDCEMACDERVIKHYADDDRINYGKALLSLVHCKREDLLTLSTAAAGKNMKRRILMIAGKRKTFVLAAILCLTLISAIGAITFTGAEVRANNTQAEKVPDILGDSEEDAFTLTPPPTPNAILTNTPIPTVTPVAISEVSYLENAYTLLNEIPSIVEQYNEFVLAKYKQYSVPITKEQVKSFDFINWIPVDEPDENIRSARMFSDIDAVTGKYALSIGDTSNCIIFSSDCEAAWLNTIALNRGYEDAIEYKIPAETVKLIKPMCEELLSGSPMAKILEDDAIQIAELEKQQKLLKVQTLHPDDFIAEVHNILNSSARQEGLTDDSITIALSRYSGGRRDARISYNMVRGLADKLQTSSWEPESIWNEILDYQPVQTFETTFEYTPIDNTRPLLPDPSYLASRNNIDIPSDYNASYFSFYPAINVVQVSINMMVSLNEYPGVEFPKTECCRFILSPETSASIKAAFEDVLREYGEDIDTTNMP